MKPKVFVNDFNKNIKNNINEYHYKRDIVNDVNVKDTINNLFDRSDFVYKNNVTITLKDNRILREDIVALRNNELITLNGNKIDINQIRNIKKNN